MMLEMSGDEDNMQDQIPTQSVRLRSSNSWIGPPWIRIALWAPIAATAVVSSKKLFEQQNYHYPHRLLAFQEIVALAILLVRYFAPQRLFITPQKRSGPSSFHFGRCQNLFQYSQIRLIPVAALLGASYLCYMQAILHLPNLVTLLMITVGFLPTFEDRVNNYTSDVVEPNRVTLPLCVEFETSPKRCCHKGSFRRISLCYCTIR